MSKQAKRERQRQRAAGEICWLDEVRAESKRQDKARQEFLAAELAKRAADPVAYDMQQGSRKNENMLRGKALASLMASVAMMGAGLSSFPHISTGRGSAYHS